MSVRQHMKLCKPVNLTVLDFLYVVLFEEQTAD